MNKRCRDLVRGLSELGYEHDRVNSKGATFYVHPDTGAEVRVPSSVDERIARGCLDEARHLVGLPTKHNKRNPAAIRERNAAEHEKAARALEAAREQRAGAVDEAAVREAEEAYLRAERRFRWWDRLMRGAA